MDIDPVEFLKAQLKDQPDREWIPMKPRRNKRALEAREPTDEERTIMLNALRKIKEAI